jgi:sodium-independent sulfate anion transporter 11
VKTPFGGVITGVLVLLALGLLTGTFYFIPKTTLAAVRNYLFLK